MSWIWSKIANIVQPLGNLMLNTQIAVWWVWYVIVGTDQFWLVTADWQWLGCSRGQALKELTQCLRLRREDHVATLTAVQGKQADQELTEHKLQHDPSLRWSNHWITVSFFWKNDGHSNASECIVFVLKKSLQAFGLDWLTQLAFFPSSHSMCLARDAPQLKFD